MASFAHFVQHLPWVTIFGVLGNTVSFMALLSPSPTMYRIYKKKSTEEFQSFPYVVSFFSGALWLFYAFTKTNMIFLVTINSIDVVIESIYLAIFLIYGNKQTRINTMKMILLFNVFGFGVIIFITFVIAKTTKARLTILGWICLIISSSVYASPLGIMRKVIRTKSVKYMPVLLSLFLTISGFVWFFYGLCKRNVYVAIPNILGFSFGMVQMVLYAIYRNAKPKDEELPIEKRDEEVILEPVKIHEPKSAPTDDDIFAIKIPDLSMINNQHATNDNEPMDQKVTEKIGLNPTPPQFGADC